MDYRQYEEYMNILMAYHPDRGRSAVRQTGLPHLDEYERMLDIVVPAYNVEAYIDDCLHSVLAQRTKHSFRVIVVNDGSTDSTAGHLEKYRGEKNVLVLEQANGGLAAARNTGLEHVTAKYVMFVDSDDCLTAHAAEKLINAAENSGAEIAAGSYFNFKEYKWLRKEYRQKAGPISDDMNLKGQAWAKVIRRELFERVCFPEGYWFEDSVMHQIIYPSAVRKVGIWANVYERRVNLQSITHTSAGNPRSLDSLWVTLRLMDDRRSLGLADTAAYYEYLLSQTVLTCKRLSLLNVNIQKYAFVILSHRINELFPPMKGKGRTAVRLEEAIRKEDFDAFAAALAAK